MTRTHFSYVVLLTCISTLPSCRHEVQAFELNEEAFVNPKKLAIDHAIEFEQELGSTEKHVDHHISIDAKILLKPQTRVLSTPRIFTRTKDKSLETEVQYYYDPTDGSVQVIFYTWRRRPTNCCDLLCYLKYHSPDSLIFYGTLSQVKYDRLSHDIVQLLGQPSEMECHGHSASGSTFRDSIRWKTKGSIWAYLYAFGNSDTGMDVVHLALYNN